MSQTLTCLYTSYSFNVRMQIAFDIVSLLIFFENIVCVYKRGSILCFSIKGTMQCVAEEQ